MSTKEDKESKEPDYDEDENQLEEKQEEETGNIILKKLEGCIEASSSNLSREDDIDKDYKNIYWELVTT